MPGILPMKVIKVGTSAQSRIAQACDRCRSKKIRCDGIRPCCSQCANVGFECKTSDKLSRRAFPRGYTESLEERVRALEQEVRELKELLDEKDEKIDMLTRIHSQSPHALDMVSMRRRSSTPPTSTDDKEDSPSKDDIFKVQQSPHLEGEGMSSYFSGSSSTKIFLEAFKRKVQETGRSTADIDLDRLLEIKTVVTEEDSDAAASVVFKAPPRLLSDHLINVFFQEWAPLFPVLHRPAFLELYGKYVADTDTITNKADIAQLNLVFGIAALSRESRSSEDLASFEAQWKAALDAILKNNTIPTLQALILAQIYCIQQGDYQSLLTYKGLSTTLSARLGLHQSQKRFAFGALTCETRKKIFWTLYTVDCFTATILGMPKQLKDEDIQCEFPVDADDEYVTERGFAPTLPGESTKLSSALALFRAARILSKVLEEVFPAKATYDLSLKRLADFSDELESWSASLPPHLRLQFAHDKPSTGTVNSRSPILSLMYHYVRALIQRPIVCAALGTRSSSAMMSMAGSCKHMIQIVQLLIERGMSFSFCLNRDEVLVLSGFGLLFQGIPLDPSSKILKDNQKMVNAVIGILSKSAASCAPEFKRVARSFIPERCEPTKKSQQSSKPNNPELARHNSDGAVPPVIVSSPTSSARKNLKAIASRLTGSGSAKKPGFDATDHRRATIHNISLQPQPIASRSVPTLQPPVPAASPYDPASTSRSEPARSPVNMFSRPSSTTTGPPSATSTSSRTTTTHPTLQPRLRTNAPTLTNLDYLSFGNEPEPQAPVAAQPTNTRTSHPIKTEPGPTDWEKLIGSLDNGQTNIYDACYGGPSVDALLDIPPLLSGSSGDTGSAAQTVHDSLSFNTPLDLWTLVQTETNGSAKSGLTVGSGQSDSILSFSTDDARGFDCSSSSEDFTTIDWTAGTSEGSGDGSLEQSGSGADVYRGICMPHDDMGFGGSNWDTPLNF